MDQLSKGKKILILTAAVFLLLACVSIGSVSAAQEIPPFPVQIWGTVTINGEPAPVGGIVTAKIGDKVLQSFILSKSGKMGEGGTFGDKFVLTASSNDVNEVITFWMGTTQAKETIVFTPGDARELTLTFERPVETAVPTQTSTNTPPVSSTPVKDTNKVVIPVMDQVKEVTSVMLQSKNNGESIPSNVRIVVSKLPETTSMPSADSYIVYQTMEITVENAPPSGVSGTLVFSIPRNNVNRAANVVMLHFVNGIWHELPTSFVSISTDGNSIIYSAETQNFSPFAIAEKVVETTQSQPSATSTTTSTTSSVYPNNDAPVESLSSEPTANPTSTPGFGLLIGAAGILGAVYLRRKY